MQRSELSALSAFSNLILLAAVRGENRYHLHSAAGESEAQAVENLPVMAQLISGRTGMPLSLPPQCTLKARPG